MANTAIGAAGEDARTITFMSKEHKEFYLECSLVRRHTVSGRHWSSTGWSLTILII